MIADVDAVVIGAGPNGLVAANVLADAGWSVVVLEAASEPGGAVRSDEHLEPGFVTDLFSAFYPLSVVSPHITSLNLESFGLEWLRAATVLAHPTPDGPTALLALDRDRTAQSLDHFAAGDGAAWVGLSDEWAAAESDLMQLLLGPFPPVHAALRPADAGVRGTGELARRAILPVRRMGEESFEGAGGRLLLAGSALHADLAPESALSGLLGWILAGIAQQHGWPVPRGGAGALTDALVRRLRSVGGQVHCGCRVDRVVIDGTGAVGVETEHGGRVMARHGVLADVVAPKLYSNLLADAAVPASTRGEMARYQPGSATFKVNWTLDAPVPWTDSDIASAGTVHIADSLDELTMTSAQLATGTLPDRPFVLVGQMNAADATRAPAGRASIWAYTDLPQRVRADAAGEIDDIEDPRGAEAFARRMEQRIEAHAPGFEQLIRRRSIQTPASMERADANLIGGDKNLGSAQMHQQLIFRPRLGLARPETPIPGLFLASASAHPGGAVHGACGANAARAAILARRRRRARQWFRR